MQTTENFIVLCFLTKMLTRLSLLKEVKVAQHSFIGYHSLGCYLRLIAVIKLNFDTDKIYA